MMTGAIARIIIGIASVLAHRSEYTGSARLLTSGVMTVSSSMRVVSILSRVSGLLIFSGDSSWIFACGFCTSRSDTGGITDEIGAHDGDSVDISICIDGSGDISCRGTICGGTEYTFQRNIPIKNEAIRVPLIRIHAKEI